MDESRSECEFRPLEASTPVKRVATCINLHDSDTCSDTSTQETPTKRRPLFESRWIDLNDTNSTISSQPSFHSDRASEHGSPEKSHFESNNDAHIEPVWVNIDNSTSIDPLDNTFAVESSENVEEHEHPSDMKGNKFLLSRRILSCNTTSM